MVLGVCSIIKEMQIFYFNKFTELITENEKFTLSAFLFPLIYVTLDMEVNGY